MKIKNRRQKIYWERMQIKENDEQVNLKGLTKTQKDKKKAYVKLKKRRKRNGVRNIKRNIK